MILHLQIVKICLFLLIDFFVVIFILVYRYDNDGFFLFFNWLERRCLIRWSFSSYWFLTGVRAADRPLTFSVIRDGQAIEMLLLLRLPSFLLVILVASHTLPAALRSQFLFLLQHLCIAVSTPHLLWRPTTLFLCLLMLHLLRRLMALLLFSKLVSLRFFFDR